MHATIAAWDGDRLTLWDKTQWVHNTADEIAAVFGIPPENVRVVSPFVGGAFGSGAAHLAARDAGSTRRPRRRAAGQADAVAARDVLRHRLPSAHGPARRPRRRARRPPRRHPARGLPGELHLRGVLGSTAEREPVPACVPERLHTPPPRTHERAHADLHARPRRGERRLRARIRHGRARGGAEYRPRRAAPAQRAAAGRVQAAAVLQPLDPGMLPGRRRALRLEPAQSRTALDARWALADRLGDGERHLSR